MGECVLVKQTILLPTPHTPEVQKQPLLQIQGYVTSMGYLTQMFSANCATYLQLLIEVPYYRQQSKYLDLYCVISAMRSQIILFYGPV